MCLPDFNSLTISIIGLGYVGLPLALAFEKEAKYSNNKLEESFQVIGFDINETRIRQLKENLDITKEISKSDMEIVKLMNLTNDLDELNLADVFIITVPTPITKSNRPDLNPLKNATEIVANAIKLRSKNKYKYSKPIIIIESTVFPGATEEFCVPILESITNLKYNKDFFCGYSPERINPGDKEHNLSSIVKVTSGSSNEASNWIDKLYRYIIKAGTHKAESIKVAEAAKVIENIQRDLNIALINELSIIFKKLNIDTLEVLKTAGTKWNFLPFKPGLVGGHCIGVDPYYLTYKAEELGYIAQVVLAGRRINDSMATWISEQVVMLISNKGMKLKDLEIIILGITFKENCPDFRNTKVVDLALNLQKYGSKIIFVDPIVNLDEVRDRLKVVIHQEIPKNKHKVIIAAVAHDQFKFISREQWSEMLEENGLLIDLKGIIPKDLVSLRL